MGKRCTFREYAKVHRDALKWLSEQADDNRINDGCPFAGEDPPLSACSWCTARTVYDSYNGDADIECDGPRFGSCWMNRALMEVTDIEKLYCWRTPHHKWTPDRVRYRRKKDILRDIKRWC